MTQPQVAHPHAQRDRGADGLRVLALLGVAAFHIRPDVVPGGFLGVVIFLTLAGFYTTRSFMHMPRLDLGNYYLKKLNKLWPPLLFVLAAVGIFSALAMPVVFAYFQNSLPSAALGWHNIAEVWRNRSYFDRSGFFDPLTHLWAMSLELQYYLFFPLIYLLFEHIRRKLAFSRRFTGGCLLALGLGSALYMGLAYQAGRDPTPYYYHSLMRAHAFLNGAGVCLLAGSRPRPGKTRAWQARPFAPTGRSRSQISASNYCSKTSSGLSLAGRTFLVWLSLLGLVGAFFSFDANSALLYRGGFYLYSLLACLYIYLGGVKPVPGLGFLKSRTFSYLAARSYHFYLWQYAVMIMLEVALRFSSAAFGLRLLLQVLLVGALSELTYQIFQAYGKLSARLQTACTATLCLILLVLTLLPQNTQAGPPKLEQTAVEEAIRANASVQASLAAAREKQSSEHEPAGSLEPDSSAEPSSTKAGVEAEAGTEIYGPTLPAEVAYRIGRLPADLLDRDEAWVSEANPFGYSQSALNVLAKLNLAIWGDSVTALAIPSIRTYVPNVYIDAAASRQFPDGLALIEALDQTGAQPDILVVAMSTNSWVEDSVIQSYVTLAGDRPLIFVNTVVPIVWESSNNQNLAAAAATYDNVYAMDWYGAVKGRPDYFYEDAFHPLPEAAEIYDRLLLDKVLEILVTGKYTLNPPVAFPAAPLVVYPIIGETAVFN